jgi:hypothetical protein
LSAIGPDQDGRVYGKLDLYSMHLFADHLQVQTKLDADQYGSILGSPTYEIEDEKKTQVAIDNIMRGSSLRISGMQMFAMNPFDAKRQGRKAHKEYIEQLKNRIKDFNNLKLLLDFQRDSVQIKIKSLNERRSQKLVIFGNQIATVKNSQRSAQDASIKLIVQVEFADIKLPNGRRCFEFPYVKIG